MQLFDSTQYVPSIKYNTIKLILFLNFTFAPIVYSNDNGQKICSEFTITDNLQTDYSVQLFDSVNTKFTLTKNSSLNYPITLSEFKIHSGCIQYISVYRYYSKAVTPLTTKLNVRRRHWIWHHVCFNGAGLENSGRKCMDMQNITHRVRYIYNGLKSNSQVKQCIFYVILFQFRMTFKTQS